MHNRYVWLKALNASGRFSSIASKRQRSSWSDLGHAAVDEKLDAGDVAAFVGSEEGGHFCNFVQGSRATERFSRKWPTTTTGIALTRRKTADKLSVSPCT